MRGGRDRPRRSRAGPCPPRVPGPPAPGGCSPFPVPPAARSGSRWRARRGILLRSGSARSRRPPPRAARRLRSRRQGGSWRGRCREREASGLIVYYKLGIHQYSRNRLRSIEFDELSSPAHTRLPASYYFIWTARPGDPEPPPDRLKRIDVGAGEEKKTTFIHYWR